MYVCSDQNRERCHFFRWHSSSSCCCCCCCWFDRICVAPNNILINHTNRLKWATHYYSDKTQTHTREQIMKRNKSSSCSLSEQRVRKEHGDSLEKPISKPPITFVQRCSLARTHARIHRKKWWSILYYFTYVYDSFLFGFDINDMWKQRNWYRCLCGCVIHNPVSSTLFAWKSLYSIYRRWQLGFSSGFIWHGILIHFRANVCRRIFLWIL